MTDNRALIPYAAPRPELIDSRGRPLREAYDRIEVARDLSGGEQQRLAAYVSLICVIIK